MNGLDDTDATCESVRCRDRCESIMAMAVLLSAIDKHENRAWV